MQFSYLHCYCTVFYVWIVFNSYPTYVIFLYMYVICSKSLGLKPENMVCGTLLFASNMDFSYKLRLLQRMKELDVKPNMLFLRFAEDAVKKAKIFIIRMVCITTLFRETEIYARKHFLRM